MTKQEIENYFKIDLERNTPYTREELQKMLRNKEINIKIWYQLTAYRRLLYLEQEQIKERNKSIPDKLREIAEALDN